MARSNKPGTFGRPTCGGGISRRLLLRSLSAAGFALPLLPSLHGRAATAARKRLLVWYTSNGALMDRWTPSGSETDFTLGQSIAALEPIKQRLLILSGIDLRTAAMDPQGTEHKKGISHALTAQKLGPGHHHKSNGGWTDGVSLDRYLGQELKKANRLPTKIPSLAVAVQPDVHSSMGKTSMARISYAAPGQPVHPFDDPTALYQELFGGPIEQSRDDMQRESGRVKSILDPIKGELRWLIDQAGAGDRQHFEQYLTHVREFETQAVTLQGPITCNKPAQPTSLAHLDNNNFHRVGQLMTDLIVSAFECDLTRIITFQWSSANSITTFNWLNYPGIGQKRHHDYSHWEGSDPRGKMVAIHQWYSERFLDLVQRLSQPRSDGSRIIDDTVILWCNGMSSSQPHRNTNIPYLLAGDCGGYFKTGRHLRYSGGSHSDLLVSLANAMGLPIKTFGMPKACNGPLARLRG